MSTQIAVRLPDEAVRFIDAQVSSGSARSRADFIWHAITRERRRLAAERDAAIYAEHGEDPEMVALATFAAQLPRPELD